MPLNQSHNEVLTLPVRNLVKGTNHAEDEPSPQSKSNTITVASHNTSKPGAGALLAGDGSQLQDSGLDKRVSEIQFEDKEIRDQLIKAQKLNQDQSYQDQNQDQDHNQDQDEDQDQNGSTEDDHPDISPRLDGSEMPGWNRLFGNGSWLDQIKSSHIPDSDSADHDDLNHASGSETPISPKIREYGDMFKTSRNRFASFRPKSTLEEADIDSEHPRKNSSIHAPHFSMSNIPYVNSSNWKDIRQSFRFINFTKRKKDDERRIDHQQSTELIAELCAGAPAALILASSFLRDEKGQKRIPVLFELLKIRITDSARNEDRQHTLFRIELQYGSGVVKLKWLIYREWKDIFNLHSRLKVINLQRNFYSSTTGNPGGHALRELPHFPRNAIPFLRGMRGLNETMEDKNIDSQDSHNVRADAGSRSSVISNPDGEIGHQKHMYYAANQRQVLEEYLRKLVNVMKCQGEANRLCRFFELSAMSLRLAIENTYHGKEGQLSIVSMSSPRGWRARKISPSQVHAIFSRYGSKWFLIRHSYILVVNSIVDIQPVDILIVDEEFKITHKAASWKWRNDNQDQSEDENGVHNTKSLGNVSFTMKLQNAERKMKVLIFSEKQVKQWMESIDHMCKNTEWFRKHRFESFAPIRYNVSAQWFVDGRDYFWNVSHAIEMARDTVYIHDWWLSPEIYLRRPAHGNQQWRLDRLLKRKAEQGVKIFVILYRNVGAAIPIDSQYTKQTLLDLHPNIFVARSPNQFRQNILFWAHHEKLVIVDHTVLFMGGLDLCFGRWDTPQHVLNDDRPTGFDRGTTIEVGSDTQLWVGKDYSNARVQDFYELNHPYDDMYDRKKIPRMPWHDVHMQMIGQTARDASRHFIQRWNYLIRQKKSTRPAPVLLPPPDFSNAELEAMGHLGTCEVQLLRSACQWSLGFMNDKVEHSILNAYLKAIEQSEHFIYIENQFFITSTEVDGTIIANQIGDALVERIIRAAKHDEDWKAVIIIPLMPGFEAEVDQQDGTSVRLIMQCQFRSISRGPHSICARLERAGINAEEYIQFFSLRKWGTVGPYEKIVTEQLYIHAKIMIVDDRVAIIGSANINERSMRGSRDSEVAAFIRDTDQIESRMGGVPYMVGRFAHTLRVRLMREHLGIDVDAVDDLERRFTDSSNLESNNFISADVGSQDIWRQFDKVRDTVNAPQSFLNEDNSMTNEVMYDSDRESGESETDSDPSDDEYPGSHEGNHGSIRTSSSRTKHRQRIKKGKTKSASFMTFDLNTSKDAENCEDGACEETQDSAKQSRQGHAADVLGYGEDQMIANKNATVNTLREVLNETSNPSLISDEQRRLNVSESDGNPAISSSNTTAADQTRSSTGNGSFADQIEALSLKPTRNHLADNECQEILDSIPPRFRSISPQSFDDPLDERFYYDMWLAHATNNTTIYRKVFKCQPDNEVKTWKDYKSYQSYAEEFANSQEKWTFNEPEVKPTSSVLNNTSSNGKSNFDTYLNSDLSANSVSATGGLSTVHSKKDVVQKINAADGMHMHRLLMSDESQKSSIGENSSNPELSRLQGYNNTRRSRRLKHKMENIMDKEMALSILNDIRGHLIIFPKDWLCKEEEA
ncbi:uncharacterized protein V1516DRAFT_678148 [Lipomyces oligophaga]|uniref:uncharacterized protein n=1 Tax=Lipomyces oligophaga TaxID=45792 RepID=UPI0034CF6E94